MLIKKQSSEESQELLSPLLCQNEDYLTAAASLQTSSAYNTLNTFVSNSSSTNASSGGGISPTRKLTPTMFEYPVHPAPVHTPSIPYHNNQLALT